MQGLTVISVDPTAVVSPLSHIEDSVKGTSILIGAGVRVDSFVRIKPVGGRGDVVIGANSYINSGTVIYSGNGVFLGENVLIAANCTLAATNHAFGARGAPIRTQGFQPSRGGIIVENDVWLGAGSVVLDGTTIGCGSVVAAGSVVRGKLEAYGIYAGSPVRLIGRRE